MLGACATPTTVTTKQTLASPFRQIEYDSVNKKSDYYAAPKVASQLRQHNFTCIFLGCKKAGDK